MLKKKNGSENKGMFWLGILAYPDYTAITKKKGSLWEYVIPALHKGPWTKTIRTKAFHPNLYPWKQKVTPPSYHNWQSPGSLTACLLSLSSNSSPASSVCVLGGGGPQLPLKELCLFLPKPPSSLFYPSKFHSSFMAPFKIPTSAPAPLRGSLWQRRCCEWCSWSCAMWQLQTSPVKSSVYTTASHESLSPLKLQMCLMSLQGSKLLEGRTHIRYFSIYKLMTLTTNSSQWVRPCAKCFICIILFNSQNNPKGRLYHHFPVLEMRKLR